MARRPGLGPEGSGVAAGPARSCVDPALAAGVARPVTGFVRPPRRSHFRRRNARYLARVGSAMAQLGDFGLGPGCLSDGLCLGRTDAYSIGQLPHGPVVEHGVPFLIRPWSDEGPRLHRGDNRCYSVPGPRPAPDRARAPQPPRPNPISSSVSIMNEFFSQGGYAFYVWSSYGMALFLLVLELLALHNRRRTILARLGRLMSVQTARDKQ